MLPYSENASTTRDPARPATCPRSKRTRSGSNANGSFSVRRPTTNRVPAVVTLKRESSRSTLISVPRANPRSVTFGFVARICSRITRSNRFNAGSCGEGLTSTTSPRTGAASAAPTEPGRYASKTNAIISVRTNNCAKQDRNPRMNDLPQMVSLLAG